LHLDKKARSFAVLIAFFSSPVPAVNTSFIQTLYQKAGYFLERSKLPLQPTPEQ
jgi:hypothetical protein